MTAEAPSCAGAAPASCAGHSFGEFVFDSSWASAYTRVLGANYYPKLQSCVPFTPVTGPRLLTKPGPFRAAVAQALADTLRQVCDELGVSSLHVTFNTEQEWEALGQRHGYLQRAGIQYWWHNRAGGGGRYSSFDDFLAHLRQSKRKSIRQVGVTFIGWGAAQWGGVGWGEVGWGGAGRGRPV